MLDPVDYSPDNPFCNAEKRLVVVGKVLLVCNRFVNHKGLHWDAMEDLTWADGPPEGIEEDEQ